MKSIHLLSVTIPASGRIIPLRDKLPARAALCCGVNMSATTHHDTLALAQVSVSFNGGQKNQTIKLPLVVKSTLATKSHPLQLLQPLDENTCVSGYVHDGGVASAYPYTVNIYFTLNQ